MKTRETVQPELARTTVMPRPRRPPPARLFNEPTTPQPVLDLLEITAPRPAFDALEPTTIWDRDEPVPTTVSPAAFARGSSSAPKPHPAPPRPPTPGATPPPARARAQGSAPGVAQHVAMGVVRGLPPVIPPPGPSIAAARRAAADGVPPAPRPPAGPAVDAPGEDPRTAGRAVGVPAAPMLGPVPAIARGFAPPPMPSPPVLVPFVAQASSPVAQPVVPPGAHALAPGSAPGLEMSAIERDVFELARRVALQSDLSAAARVLQHGLSRLTGSPDAMCVLFDPALRSAWAAPIGKTVRPIDDQAQPLIAQVALSGQRAVLGRALIEPVGPAPARAVLAVRRPAGSPAYGPGEVATLAAIAAAVTGILGHFIAAYGVQREQEQRDARTPFRPEALAARRGAAAAPGRMVVTPRAWIRWAYPTLIGLVAAALVATLVIQVPTYSTGMSIIMVEGEHVTAPQPGTVAEVLVAPNAHVAAGDPVVRMRAIDEEAELAATETDYRNALATFLTNTGDDSARNALAGIATRRQRARAIVDARTLRATTAGIVGDIRVRPGQLLPPGAPVLKVAPRAEPSVVALMPGTDRPRLEVGMTLQIDLPGYHKRRETAVIDSIGSQVIGPDEARRSLGDPIGDALPIAGPVVLVRAHLATRTFEASGREYEFHDGMVGKAEIEVDHESLIHLLLPGTGD